MNTAPEDAGNTTLEVVLDHQFRSAIVVTAEGERVKVTYNGSRYMVEEPPEFGRWIYLSISDQNTLQWSTWHDPNGLLNAVPEGKCRPMRDAIRLLGASRAVRVARVRWGKPGVFALRGSAPDGVALAPGASFGQVSRGKARPKSCALQ